MSTAPVTMGVDGRYASENRIRQRTAPSRYREHEQGRHERPDARPP
jgi:hypothetical protein